jgi:radical SAM superfamily enzyme YgiQ (UPF0313 family)
LQIQQILKAIRHIDPSIQIVIGGSAISLIHDAPLRWWPELKITACYNGFGCEIPELIKACFSGKKVAIPGVYWQPGSFFTRGTSSLIDYYSPNDFYSSRGRRDIKTYLKSIQNAGLEPLAILEMTRGCKNKCTFCAINRNFGCFSRDPELIAGEAEFLVKHGVGYFHIIDPTFGLEHKKSRILLSQLADFHKQHLNVRFEMLTRAEMIDKAMADALATAGVTRCAIGMETMSELQLNNVHKSVTANHTRRAIELLSERDIEVKLFHILFPDCFSTETLSFLSELSKKNIRFIVQSSLLRELPDRQSSPEFLA